MGEVPTVAEVHPKDRVTWLKQGKKHRKIRLSAAVRLNICPISTKKLFGPCNRQFFDGIDVLATAVIAFMGQAFGIFIRQDRPLSFPFCRKSRLV